MLLHFKSLNMNSLFSKPFLLILFYFFILFMNLVVFVFSIFLLIINSKERKNKQIQLYQLSITFQICLCCILHSIFFIIYPYNEQYSFLSIIQGFLSITSLLECINIIAAKFYFCYLYSKESKKYKEKSYLLGQIILSWIIPIIYGLICIRYGDIKVNYSTFFSWVDKDVFMYPFTSLFGIGFLIAMFFTCKINAGMHEVVRGTTESQMITILCLGKLELIIYSIFFIDCV